MKFISKSIGVDKALSYEGARTAEDVVAYIQKKSGPASDLLESMEELKAFVEKAENNYVVCVFFGDDEGEDFEVFKAVAMSQEKVLFGNVELADARAEYKVPEGVKVVLFKGFEEKRNDFAGNLDVEGLTQFVNANQLPSLIPFNDKAIQAIFQQSNTGIFLFCNESEESLTALENFAVVAKEFKSQVIFTFSKPNDESGLFSRLAEYVGASTNDLPNVMLMNPQNENAKYRFEQKELSVDNLRKFVSDFLAGNLQRYMKSEDIPEKNDDPVKVLVGKQFQELVIDNTKDVLVEFYAPWCGHCKQLAPIYEELAKSLAANPNILIAKCDATANEVPSSIPHPPRSKESTSNPSPLSSSGKTARRTLPSPSLETEPSKDS